MSVRRTADIPCMKDERGRPAAMAFSASESAFEGFRIIRREPATVAIWAVVLLVLGAIVSATMLPVLGQFAAGITPGATATSPAQLAAFGHLMQLYLVVFPLYLVLLSVFTAAIYRVVLRPQDRGFARLKLGADELRLVGLCLLMGLLSIGFSLVVLLVAGALVAGLALAFRTSAPAVGVIGAILIYLLMIAAYIWVGVRLSFAAPTTRRTMKIGDSRFMAEVTSGRNIVVATRLKEPPAAPSIKTPLTTRSTRSTRTMNTQARR